MKTIKLILLSIVAATFLLISCKAKESKRENSTSEVNVDTKKGKYGIKSGVVEYKTTAMGMDVKQRLIIMAQKKLRKLQWK